MLISGLQKLTLLDFPGHTACTVFTFGCNLRCPFCHNTPLVTGKPDDIINEEEFFSFLKKRQGLLDGVAITGGEPLLQKDIADFIKRIKDMGFAVKLDTNGTKPEVLHKLLEKKLIDFVAMDIKNTKEKYSLTSGCEIDFSAVEKSIELIKKSGIEHEFRTTAVKEFHSEGDLVKIAEALGKNEKYYIQQFKDSGNILSPDCHALPDEALRAAAEKCARHVFLCETRGI